ncbi:MAG: tetratricopeptide repeat protein [Pyrinomonadaceae bacterium]
MLDTQVSVPPRRRARVAFLTGVFLLCVITATAQSGPGVDNNKGLPDNRIEGRLYFPSGNPGTPIRVRLSGDRGETTTNSDRDGRFGFRGLRPGRYTITVEGDTAYQSVSQMVDVMPLGSGSMQGDNPSQTASLNIRLQLKTSFDSGSGLGTADINKTPKEAVELYNSALKSASEGDRKKATELLKKALSIHPKFVAALNGLGVQYMKLGELDNASETFSSALKIEPELFILRLNYGLVLFQQKKYSEANHELDLALKKNEASSTAHFYKGRVLIALQRYDDAILEFQRVIALKGEEANVAHRYLGGLYVEKGDKAQAISELQAFLKLEPKAKEAEKIREMIKQLQE